MMRFLIFFLLIGALSFANENTKMENFNKLHGYQSTPVSSMDSEHLKSQIQSLDRAGSGICNEGVDFLQKQQTPESSTLVENGGNLLHRGWFDTPFAEVNLLAPFKNPIKRFLLKNLRQKKWQYFSFTTSNTIVGLATVDAGFVGNFFLYVFDLDTKKKVQIEHLSPLKPAAKVSDNSLDGFSSYIAPGIRMSVENHYKDGYYRVVFSCSDKDGNLVEGNVMVHTSGEEYVNSNEVLPGRIVYTHQNSMFRPEGFVRVNGKQTLLNPETDYAAMDYTRGLHSYHTEWNWCSAAGKAEDGTLIAVNFSTPLNGKTGPNSTYWINGKVYRRDDVVFQYEDILNTWKISSVDGTINLSFEPLGLRSGDVNLGVIVSRFKQPFGIFEGTVTGPDGKVHTVKNMLGVTEEHLAKW